MNHSNQTNRLTIVTSSRNSNNSCRSTTTTTPTRPSIVTSRTAMEVVVVLLLPHPDPQTHHCHQMLRHRCASVSPLLHFRIWSPDCHIHRCQRIQLKQLWVWISIGTCIAQRPKRLTHGYRFLRGFGRQKWHLILWPHFLKICLSWCLHVFKWWSS